MKPFDFFKAIGNTKLDILDTTEGVKDWKGMNFPIMREFSRHIDSVLIVEELNRNMNMQPNSMFYILQGRIRKMHRTWKGGKPTEDSKHFDIVSKHYGYSRQKTEEAIALLSEEFIESLYHLYDEGGSGRARVKTKPKKKAK